jgi:hypothetical protein
METEVPEEREEDTTSHSSDWDSRVLCSDGNCIGVIGPDGHCKECGRKHDGELPEMKDSGEDDDAVADEVNVSEATTELLDDADADPEPIADDDEWGNRVLCSDGNCIGVIGTDGKCKECGKPGK